MYFFTVVSTAYGESQFATYGIKNLPRSLERDFEFNFPRAYQAARERNGYRELDAVKQALDAMAERYASDEFVWERVNTNMVCLIDDVGKMRKFIRELGEVSDMGRSITMRHPI